MAKYRLYLLRETSALARSLIKCMLCSVTVSLSNSHKLTVQHFLLALSLVHQQNTLDAEILISL